jgi:hypothetical protein
MEDVIDAPAKVANRLSDLALQVAQEFLRCVTLGHIELVFAKLYLMLADADLQRPAVGKNDPQAVVGLM